ncbi:MAG: hypothetical protein KME54_04385 [Tolypothrix brevis GSE-NOS-MK-07-07A]|nr:hypothetical protein [Tolypothrix brevis GSE-NOS-MK-07-07A]
MVVILPVEAPASPTAIVTSRWRFRLKQYPTKTQKALLWLQFQRHSFNGRTNQ